MSDEITQSAFGHLGESHSALERRHEELKVRMDLHADQMTALAATSKKNGERIDLQGTELRANTKATQRVEKNTEEIITAFNAAKGAFKAIEVTASVVTKIAVIVAPIAAVLGLFIAWWKGGIAWLIDFFSAR